MKRSLLLLLCVASLHTNAQTEFTVYDNGLIYSNHTMQRLGVIVDSLNIRFRTCDISEPYYCMPQGSATYVKITNNQALKLIESNVSLQQYLTKYPNTESRNVYIVKDRYTDYTDVVKIHYYSVNDVSLTVADIPANDKTSGWIVDEDKEHAFYIHRLEQKKLPESYARLIQYVDCMIDTTALIYLPSAGENENYTNSNTSAAEFIKWTEDYSPSRPAYPGKDEIKNLNIDSLYHVYTRLRREWDSLRLVHLDKKIAAYPHWHNKLKQAVAYATATGDSDEQLEFYVERYISKQQALQLKRSRKVVGICSMDQSPRYHAMNICRLSAETSQWDIFLRSHLDIMNDRFERASDGSYAQQQRKTYLKELEELNIPAADLLLGTCLNVSNVSKNHYWGSISRIGRALTDVNDHNKIEAQLLTMIKDPALDLHNRLRMAYLFSHYANNLEDATHKETCLNDLEKIMVTSPPALKDAWAREEE